MFFRTTSLKSHDWKEVSCPSSYIDIWYYTPLCYLCQLHFFCIQITAHSKEHFEVLHSWNASGLSTEDTVPIFGCNTLSECVDKESIEQIELDLNLALALMERDFPTDIQVCTYIIATTMPIYFAGMNRL